MPIQIIWGNDINSSNKEIAKIVDVNVSKVWKDLNITRFNGEDNNQVLYAFQELQTPPMGDGNRVVILNNNPIFNQKNEELINNFEQIINNIPNTTYFILQNLTKPDSRLKSTKLLKSLIKEGKVIETCHNLPDMWNKDEQINFVKETAKNMNIKIDYDATTHIIDSIGIDSYRLVNELEKAKLYLSAKNKKSDSSIILTKETVKKIFNDYQSNIFKILDYLIETNVSQSLVEIHMLLSKGEPPLRLTSGLISQIRMYTIVSLLLNEKDISKICDLANIANPKRIFFIKQKVKKCSPKYLINVMIQLLNIESLIKKGNNPKDVFTENFITLKS